MLSENKSKVLMFIICLMGALRMGLNGFSIYLVVGVLSIPFIIVMKEEIILKEIDLNELCTLIQQYSNVEGISSVTDESVKIIKRYIKVKESLNSVFYVNYNCLRPYDEFERMMNLTEKKMINAMKKIYSKLTLLSAKGNDPEESDYQYINRYLDIGREAIREVSKMVNEISELYHSDFNMQSVKNFNEHLHSLNNKNN